MNNSNEDDKVKILIVDDESGNIFYLKRLLEYENYSVLTAILVSALLFGLVHMNLQQGIFAFLAGCFYGFIYWQSKSLLLCILLHALNNFLSFTVSAIWDFDSSLSSLINSSFTFLVIYFIAAIGITYSILSIYKNGLKPNS